MMPKPSAPLNKPDIKLPGPTVVGVVPPIPGGEDNLLPRDAWLRPLRIEFDWWDDPAEASTVCDTIKLIWDDDEQNPVAQKEYFGTGSPPTRPSDLWLEVPVTDLDEGVHTLYYVLDPWNLSGPQSSEKITVTIDKTPPVFAANSKPIFPPEILPPNKLTAYYLEGEDQLKAEIPLYTSPMPGDVITWYWDRNSSGTTVGGTLVLTADNYDKPLVVAIEGDFIRGHGDGERYVWYTAVDRAGNPTNGQSAVQRLDVSAQPIPRNLPPPKVVEASGTGWPERGTLNPINALDGANVILNPASVIHPGEVPQVQWAAEGELGAYLADPLSDDDWRYEIPKTHLAPHFGKVIPVVYLFKDKLGKSHQSDPYALTVLKYPSDRLHAPESADGSPLSFAAVPATGASIILTKWPFSAVGQRITIFVEGTESSSGKTIRTTVLDKKEINAGQAAEGIARGEALVAKAGFLAGIRLNSQLTVKAYVSFDDGLTWDGQAEPNPATAQFPWLRLTLTD